MSDDTISRQWLMECVNEGWIKFDTEKDENRFIHLVRDIAPSAQPDLSEYSDKLWKAAYERGKAEAQRTGRWIIKDNPGTGWYRVTCSECGEDVTSTAPCIGFYPNAKVTWDYCPNCGTRMEGNNESD